MESTNVISQLLLNYEHEIYVFFLSMVPIFELRGAVPIGLGMGMPWYEVLPVAIVGNCLVVPLVVLLGREIMLLGKKFSLTARLFHAVERRTLAKEKVIRKYSIPGLILLVAIPLPGTGAWTGALLAALLRLRVKEAMLACCTGVVISGVIMTLISVPFF